MGFEKLLSGGGGIGNKIEKRRNEKKKSKD